MKNQILITYPDFLDLMLLLVFTANLAVHDELLVLQPSSNTLLSLLILMQSTQKFYFRSFYFKREKLLICKHKLRYLNL